MRTSTFALLFGIAYLVAGLMGLLPVLLVPPPIDAPPTQFTLLYGYLLGLFPVNLLHSLLHIVIGVWGLSAWSGRTSGISFARGLAVLYGVLAVMGMIPMLNTTLGMVPLHGNDVWLHGLTAVIAAYFGWRQPAAMRERRHVLGDRRQRVFSVGRERRLGLADRREGFGEMHPA
ncbi:MAG TPA: DUF4383 domain-containing protein [Burkholderiales bacterium]|nr:DUF4383 domain-containing protein [Burkholderiales bacterium]